MAVQTRRQLVEVYDARDAVVVQHRIAISPIPASDPVLGSMIKGPSLTAFLSFRYVALTPCLVTLNVEDDA